MTEPLHRDPALMRCEATVLRLTEEGAVILDRSVFYPTGGGQPGDRGRLRFGEREAEVTGAVKGDGAEVLHLLAAGAPCPAPGETVEAEIDGALRRLHSRVHTLLHLLSVIIPLPVTGGQISEGYGRLDFNMPEAPEDKAALEDALNALIAGDHPVSDEWITDEELAARPEMVKTMRVKPPVGLGRVRLVRIGAGPEPVDLQPCGGTHVSSTAEIGKVHLGKIEKKGKENRRVYVHLGE